MSTGRFQRNGSVTQRLLELRSQAGASAERHARYHTLVNRYQRLLLRNYLVRYRHRLRAGLHVWRRLGLRLLRPWGRVRDYASVLHHHLKPRSHAPHRHPRHPRPAQ